MTAITNIWTVAKFEFRTLMRSWFFRIFSILAIVLLGLADLALLTEIAPSPWEFRGIPSSIPYLNILLLNVIQAVIAIFISSDFLKRDRKLDTTEAIYTRPVSNPEYVLGKISAVLFAFFILNAAVLIVGLVYNVFFAGVGVMPLSYLLYPLLISLPTVLFILGLSALFMVTVRNQAVTFILLLGYVATTMFYLSTKFYNLFDYLGFNVPLFYSDITGFSGLSGLLMQRGVYFCLGVSFILITILALKRLKQSKKSVYVCGILASVFLVAAVSLGAGYISEETGLEKARERMSVINSDFSEAPALDIERCSLELEHAGSGIRAQAELTFKNRSGNPVRQYLFNLNPGLEVESVASRGEELEFERDFHLLRVTPPSPLSAGERDSLEISYSGSIDERICYPDVETDQIRHKYRITFFCAKKKYSFVRPDYLLLTPEAHWYPESGPGYRESNPVYPDNDFISFSLNLNTRPGLTPVSQGEISSVGEGEFTIEPDKPLPGLTVAVGRYEKRQITVDSLTYSVHNIRGHDYFMKYLDQLADTLPRIIRDEKKDYEGDLELEYPYGRLRLVEVPINHFCYRRLWTLDYEVVQPEMVLLPEMGLNLNMADFRRRAWFFRRRESRTNQETPEIEMQARMFALFCNTLTGNLRPAEFRRRSSLNASYNIFPCYYQHVNNIESYTYPMLDIAVKSYLGEKLVNPSSDFFRFVIGMSDNEKANMELSERSMRDIMNDPESRDILPFVLNMKGKYLLRLLGSRTGEEELFSYLKNVLRMNRFSELSGERFTSGLSERFGIDMKGYLNDWYLSSSVPGFVLRDVEKYKFIRGERTRYQVRFNLANGKDVDGIVKVTLSKRGGRRRRFGPPGRGDGQETTTERYIYLQGGEAREVGLVLNYQPSQMVVNTMVSENLPAELREDFEEFETRENPDILDGVRQLPLRKVIRKEEGVIVVDNEDPGFEPMGKEKTSLLKRVMPAFWRSDDDEKYTGLRFWDSSGRWKATLNYKFYGKYIRSAHFVSTGDGDIKAAWNADIRKSGYYDIYCYVSKIRAPWRRRDRQDHSYGSNHYLIYHDDGTEETGINLDNASEGWNFMGSYYFSAGKARVEITNQGEGRFVIADAVKWVPQ